MGACVSTEYTPDSISNANLLLAIIRSSGGQIAIYGLCLSVVLACLTTAISQITAVADFYETATHGKLSYKVLVMIVPIVTTIVASFGLDTIVSLTSPWFSFFYPITLVMTILGIFEKKIPNDGAFKGRCVLHSDLRRSGSAPRVWFRLPGPRSESHPPLWSGLRLDRSRHRGLHRGSHCLEGQGPHGDLSKLFLKNYTVLEWNAQSA